MLLSKTFKDKRYWVIWLTAIVGLLVCAGWILHIPVLKQIVPWFQAMKFNSALLFVFTALAFHALIQGKQTIFKFLSLFVFGVGFFTIMQTILGTDLGIDELFVKDDTTHDGFSEHPGRMAPASAICFALLGLGLFGAISEKRTAKFLSQMCFHVISLFSFAGAVAYLFLIPNMFNWFRHSYIPLISVLLFLTLSVMASLINRHLGLTILFTYQRSGSIMARRLLPKMIVMVLLIGFAVQLITLHTNYKLDFSIALCTVLFCVTGFILVWHTAAQLNVIDNQRLEIAERFSELNTELELRVEQKTNEYKKANEELEHQKELFLKLFREGPVPKILANIKTGVVVDCSDAYLELFGFTREEVLGKTAVETGIISGKEWGRIVIDQIGTPGDAVLEDYELKDRHGEHLWVSAFSSVLTIHHEDHVLSTLLDVTDRKKIENNYRYILENASDIIYTTNEEGNFDFISGSVTHLTGFESAELVGNHFTHLVHPDYKQRVKLFYLKQFKGKSDQSYLEFKILNKSGEERWMGQNVKIFRDTYGRYRGFHAVARDITDRKNLETDLQLKNERLEEAMRIGRFGYFEHDLLSNKISRSKELIDMFGDSGMSVNREGEAQFDMVMPEYVPEFERHINRLTTLKQQSTVEYQIRTSDGKQKYIATHASPVVDLNGNVIAIRGTTRDVTAQKNFEKELRSAKELSEQSVKLKDRFLANMTHEIRTPMTGILGFSGLLNASPLNPKQKEWLKTIISSGENLLVILDDLLDFSKIEAGMIHLELLPVEIKGILQSFITLSEIKAKEKGIDLSLVLSGDIPELVVTDKVRLQQIFMNLLNNSIKFTSSGYVKLSAALLTETANQVTIEFKVSDSGIGISRAQSERIFERFTQASSETTRKYGGTGLGLSIVKELTHLLKGTIRLKSVLGEGSEFTVVLPFEKCTPEQIEHHSGNSGESVKADDLSLDNVKILLTEDNRINQKFLTTVLEELGFTVKLANNGKEAIDIVRSEHFDLILMDIQMPVMDGLEATTIIRNYAKNATPIIAISANAIGDEKQRCIDLGMNDYITKPVVISELYTKIKNLLPHKLVRSIDQTRELETPENREQNEFDPEELRVKLNGDNKAFNELISVFLEATPKDVRKLELAINERIFKAAEQLSHKLVSSFSIMCVPTAADLLREMEHLSEKSTSIEEVRILFDKFELIYERVKTKCEEIV